MSSRPELWAGLHLHDKVERGAMRLAATPDVEVWAIGWTTGQGVDLHDHGPSAGVLVVVEGELEETRLTHGQLRHHRLGTGRRRCLPVGLVHDVRNPHGPAATSIHVYSPPLITMGRWDVATGTRTGIDAITPEPTRHHAATVLPADVLAADVSP